MSEQKYPAGYLSGMQINIQRPLTVFLPPVHRYIDPQYAKLFRETGQLRISSFAKFKQHQDEHRGDKSEGEAFSIINDLENDRHFSVMTMSGTNAYVLSTTMRTGADVAAAFGDASFEIFEPLGFCAEVANEIPGCTHAMVGQCVYVDEKMLVSSGKAPTTEDLKSETEPDKLDVNKVLANGSALSGPKPYFLKNRNYEWQAEYRFIWETNKSVTSHLDINAPNLIRNCKF